MPIDDHARLQAIDGVDLSAAHQIAAVHDQINANPAQIRGDRLESREIRVDIGNDGNPHGDPVKDTPRWTLRISRRTQSDLDGRRRAAGAASTHSFHGSDAPWPEEQA